MTTQDIVDAPSGTVIRDAYEEQLAAYWNTKQNDPVNLLLGEIDGLYHHHYGIGDYDPAILGLAPEQREEAILREMHRLENAQAELIVQSLAGTGPQDRVLDAGSGRGGTSFQLHDRFGCYVDGANISQYHLEFSRRAAQERGYQDKVRFHFRNMVDTGFTAGSFQGVITNETTMYVELPELFGEFARILEPGGRYVCITWCRNDLVADSCPQSEEIDRHYISRMHRRSSYFTAMADAGLVPISVIDLTDEAIPYWELRTHSRHRTGIEDAFIDAYRTRQMNFLLIVAENKG